MKKAAALTLVLLFACAFAVSAEEPWKPVKDADGIKVFMRQVPGSNSTEFKGTGDVKAPLEVVRKVYEDIPSFPQWYGFCREARELRRDTHNHRVMYIVIETLGPVKDRDLVADVRSEDKPDRTIITVNAIPDDLVPRQGRYVRMTELTGTVLLTRVDPETTNVVYTVRSNPGGYIPAWLSDLIQKDQPYLTIRGLREMVRKDVYYEKAGISRNK
ncbi:MAG TPA: START domain-containing protein [Deltaproteobacteria bacterium]|jgi:hypothetical protein|nr:START domain-containing protein [Deltaproteobacteria bacterium]HOI06185.1 START domain-containing protein [Deltaproteobacteria bacterium]